MQVTCEGYKIAYSSIDSTCEECLMAANCKQATNHKLLNAKIEGGSTMEKLTKEQLSGLLEAATLKKEVAQINKKGGYGCALVKGMTIEEAKELILATAFPPEAEEEDGFELEDEDDDFGDFEDSDSTSEVEETTETAADDAGTAEGADDDLEGLEDSDLHDDPDSDATTTAGTPTEDMTTTAGTPDPDQSPDIPEGMDEEEYDSLIGRISHMEKRLDDIYQILAAGKGTNSKSKAAEAGAAAADEGEKLKAGMPYSDEDLDKMNAKIIKRLCKAIGINSFQKKVVDLVPQIKAYQDENCK